MKKILIALVILFVIPLAYADWFYNSDRIVVDMYIYSYADIVKTSSNGYVESASINLSFFPKDTENQEVIDYETIPESEASDGSLIFSWKTPSEKIEFWYTGRIEIINRMPKIRHKVIFPIQDIPEDILIYTKPSNTIDSDNEDIIKLASDIVEGEDDLYTAVFRIADWTKHNIKYDLSTLTADVSQKASWVLENRFGVCDELTSLFIAMLRAVGIPAKFVSGMSYTNSPLFPENWGPHGWAEVYFPDYGWVPFDVTYGEYGWVDPTHIKFKDSVDSDEASTYFKWLGRNAELETRDLDIKTTMVQKSGKVVPQLSLSAKMLRNEASFGSYNLVEATVENNAYYYQATELHINKPKELKIIGEESKSILLLPNEKKKIYWILKVDEGLNSRYSYTFPITVSTTSNLTAKTSFEADTRQAQVTYDEVNQAALLLEEETKKEYSGNVLLECSISNADFYSDESAEAKCKAKNTGNIYLDSLKACFQDDCSGFNLGISQEKTFTFKIDSLGEGTKEIPVTLRNEIVSKSAYLSFLVKDRPKAGIDGIDYPLNVSYDGNFSISFSVKSLSQSNPKNVEVQLRQNAVEKIWDIDELEDSSKFVVIIEGNQLRFGRNEYEITVNYYDDDGNKYSTSESFEVQLADASLLQRAALSLNGLEWLSTEGMAIILLTGTVAFLVVVGMILRKKK